MQRTSFLRFVADSPSRLYRGRVRSQVLSWREAR